MLSPVLSKPAEISRSVAHGEGVAVDRGRAARRVPRHSAGSVPPPEASHKMPPSTQAGAFSRLSHIRFILSWLQPVGEEELHGV